MKTSFFRGLWAVLCSSLLSCSQPPHADDAFVDQLLDALAQTEGGLLHVADVSGFDWDQMFVFGPYTPTDHVAATTGIGTLEIERSGIEARDDVSLLIFLDDGRLAKLTAVPRGKLDFASVGAEGPLSPQQAVFTGAESEGVPRLRLVERTD